MIRAVLFDNGGVLTEGGKVGATHQIFAKMYKDYEPNERFRALLAQLFRGKIETDIFFEEMNKLFPGNGNPDKNAFLAHANAPFVKSESVRELASKLREAGVRTGIVSNVIEIVARKHERQGDYADFDPVILSCDVGAAKPDPEFYQLALNKLQLPAREVLFIDDRETSLVPARQLGMSTIVAESPAQIVKQISLLVRHENNLDLALES